MIEALEIPISKVKKSKLPDLDWSSLPFGKYFTDHMLEAEYENGKWVNVQIRPYQALTMEPSLSAIHYGQAIFEGIKAYKDTEGNAFIFRPYDNYRRFNISAERMDMPHVPEEIFIEGMRQLINLDKEWIPTKPDHSLYIRPFMYATDTALGVRTSSTYKFLIILSPTGPYHSAPMRICVEEKYTRAAPGGVGFTKNAGNYGGSMLAAANAKKKGYDQVLWTDAFEHKWLQEVGMMNVIFVIGDTAITPSLEEGTILAGVTRNSAVTLLKEDMKMKVEERNISIDEVVEAHKKGTLREIFGTGTAATISMIKELSYKDYSIEFDMDNCPVATELKKRMDDIKSGLAEDTRGWLLNV